MQLRPQLAAGRQPEVAAETVELWAQRLVPPACVDLDPALRDLPGVPDPAVENRELAVPVSCRTRDLAQLPCLRPRHGQPDRPNASHLDLQIARRRTPRRAERLRGSSTGEQSSQVIAGGGHVRPYFYTVRTHAFSIDRSAADDRHAPPPLRGSPGR